MLKGSEDRSGRSESSNQEPQCLALLRQPLKSTSQVTEAAWATAGDIAGGQLDPADGRSISSVYGRIIQTLELELRYGMKAKIRQPIEMSPS
jgi:hypothetical protein